MPQLLSVPRAGQPATLALRQWPPAAGPATGTVPVLLLHGISSGAGSWQRVADALPGHLLLAWDAPGYGPSTPLAQAAPAADDYAAVALQALDALDLRRVLLVGHSLGCIVAAALAARLGPRRLHGLLLLSPARGYGADAAKADAVRRQRLQALDKQGVAGLAATVSARLLSAQASPEQHGQVQQVAQGLTPGGYAQAVHLLCGSDLLALLQAARGSALADAPVQVAVGAEDVITPPAACAELAAALHAPVTRIDRCGHACAIEQPALVAALIRQMAARP